MTAAAAIGAGASVSRSPSRAHGLATNPGWDWPTFGGYFFERSVLHALPVTLELTFAGAVLGFLGGIVLAARRRSCTSPRARSSTWPTASH
jgi:polar amino acid transport system permease protein